MNETTEKYSNVVAFEKRDNGRTAAYCWCLCCLFFCCRTHSGVPELEGSYRAYIKILAYLIEVAYARKGMNMRGKHFKARVIRTRME